ncbi:hypothetical protein NFJ02_06g124970 [Pycnococcus provasolii]
MGAGDSARLAADRLPSMLPTISPTEEGRAGGSRGGQWRGADALQAETFTEMRERIEDGIRVRLEVQIHGITLHEPPSGIRNNPAAPC